MPAQAGITLTFPIPESSPTLALLNQSMAEIHGRQLMTAESPIAAICSEAVGLNKDSTISNWLPFRMELQPTCMLGQSTFINARSCRARTPVTAPVTHS